MAENVVIKDSEGTDVVYENASEVELRTDSGGTAVFVHSDEIPDQVQADWDQTDGTALDFIKNKPFGTMPDIVPEKEYTFGLGDDGVEGIYSASDFALSQPLVVGETYIVTWGDEKFECVARDAKTISGIPEGVTFEYDAYIGNSSLTGKSFGMDWGEDTGEPFMIGAGMDTDDTTQTVRKVRVVAVNNKKKLSAEWLPDGLATEEFVKEQIAAIEIPEGGGSGGSVSTETVILEEQTISGFGLEEDSTCALTMLEGESFVFAEGETYTVIWDGVEYLSTVCILSVNDVSINLLGNGSLGDPDLLDTGEPFVIYTMPVEMAGGAEISVFGSSDTSATSHTVAIYQKTPLSVSWKNVTNKPFGDDFIEDGVHKEYTVLLPSDGANLNTVHPDYGIYFVSAEIPTSLVIGATYRVTWNGSIFDCVAQDSSSVQAGGIVIGNASAFGLNGNDEPFVMMSEVDGTDIMIGSTTATEPIKVEGLSVSQITSTLAPVIKKSYIPDSIKLPAVAAADNGKVLMVVDGAWAVVDLPNG